MIGLPPVAPAVNATLTVPSPGIATSAVGADGGARRVTVTV